MVYVDTGFDLDLYKIPSHDILQNRIESNELKSGVGGTIEQWLNRVNKVGLAVVICPKPSLNFYGLIDSFVDLIRPKWE